MRNLGTSELHELYELRILEHVETSPRLTHRKASRVLGVSVKLAHEVLTRMVGRGLMHVHKHHARRWDYFLTPAGVAEKARLTLEFLDFSMHFYRQARRDSAALCRRLAEGGAKHVALLGHNELTEIVYLGCQEWDLQLDAVYADDDAERFMGRPIRPLSALPDYQGEAVIVCFYDAAEPMRARYLPADLAAEARMHWIFDAALTSSSEAQAGHGAKEGPEA